MIPRIPVKPKRDKTEVELLRERIEKLEADNAELKKKVALSDQRLLKMEKTGKE